MYVPAPFDVNDLPALHAFMERYSFATVVTVVHGAPFASHLPLLLDRERGRFGTLVGHVARANPHAQMGGAGHESLAIFQGPHGYISPRWYQTDHPHVPTWNYTVVHACGRLSLIEDEEWLRRLLRRMVSTYETPLARPWEYDTADQRRDKLLGAIVGFELPIERLEGKFKLSQNRDSADRAGAVAGLESSGESHSAELASFMREFYATQPVPT